MNSTLEKDQKTSRMAPLIGLESYVATTTKRRTFLSKEEREAKKIAEEAQKALTDLHRLEFVFDDSLPGRERTTEEVPEDRLQQIADKTTREDLEECATETVGMTEDEIDEMVFQKMADDTAQAAVLELSTEVLAETKIASSISTIEEVGDGSRNRRGTPGRGCTERKRKGNEHFCTACGDVVTDLLREGKKLAYTEATIRVGKSKRILWWCQPCAETESVEAEIEALGTLSD